MWGGGDICTLFNLILVFTPLSIQGCCLWLDGADSTTISITSSKVSGWNDKSGRNYHFAQSTATYRPTYANNVLTFNYSNTNYLIGNAAATNFTVGTKSYAFFAVCSITTAGMTNTASSIYCKAPYSNSTGRIFIFRNAGANPSYLNVRFAKDASAEYGIPENTPANTYRIIELIVNRTVSNADYIYITGNLMRTTTYSHDTTNYTTAFNMIIGGFNGASGTNGTTSPGYFLDGSIAEIVSYSNSNDMTNPQREKIEGYLAWKWSIQTSLPSGHPYQYFPP